jgi:hypothetical protein
VKPRTVHGGIARRSRRARPHPVRRPDRRPRRRDRRNRVSASALIDLRPTVRDLPRVRLLRRRGRQRLRPYPCLDGGRERHRRRRTNLVDRGRLDRRSRGFRPGTVAQRDVIHGSGRRRHRRDRAGLARRGRCRLLYGRRHRSCISCRHGRDRRGRGVHWRGGSAHGLGRPFDHRLGRRVRLCRRSDRRRARRGDLGSRRQEPERIHISLRIAGHAHAEIDIGRITVPTHGTDDGGLADESSSLHPDRSEVQERRGVAEGCLNRNSLAAVRNRPRERHHSFDGREHRCADRRAEVDTAMLPARVGRGRVEHKRAQDRPVHRPGPRARNRDG